MVNVKHLAAITAFFISATTFAENYAPRGYSIVQPDLDRAEATGVAPTMTPASDKLHIGNVQLYIINDNDEKVTVNN